MHKHATILIVAMALLAACSDGDWKGTAYPDSFDRSQPDDLGFFTSFESCQKAGVKRAAELSKAGSGSDYECGYKCAFDLDTKVTTCEATRK